MQPRVQVTNHAITRLRGRFAADFSGVDTPALRRHAAGEVVDAIASHRMATRLPKFALRAGTSARSRGRRGRGELDRSLRYVWTADERRVYLIDRTRRATTILTVLAATGHVEADTDADVDAA